jgi:hypothetical protein
MTTLLPPLHETLYAGYVKLFAETLELLTHTVFQIVVRKMAVLGVHPSGAQKDGHQRVLNWDSRENEGDQFHGADFCR